MDEDKEEEKKEEEKPEETPATTTPLIDAANDVAKRIKEQNDRAEELQLRQEQLMAKQALGGNSEAGIAPEKKEETDIEYKNRVMSGVL